MTVSRRSSRAILQASLFAVLSLAVFGNAAFAQWSLDNEASTLSFVTVKADHVAEVHTFDSLSGTVNESGTVQVTIELASVNTLIPIRNERMQAMLFETGMFPRAGISANVDVASLGGLSAGEVMNHSIEFSLDLHGTAKTYTAEVQIIRLADGVSVSTVKPILVQAGDHDLITGVEALREVAGLPSISQAVPVSFTLAFTR